MEWNGTAVLLWCVSVPSLLAGLRVSAQSTTTLCIIYSRVTQRERERQKQPGRFCVLFCCQETGTGPCEGKVVVVLTKQSEVLERGGEGGEKQG